MKQVKYTINDKNHELSMEDFSPFFYGKDELLSNIYTDITFNQSWYQKGYEVFNVLDNKSFINLKNGVADCIKNILNSELGISIQNFQLENYQKTGRYILFFMGKYLCLRKKTKSVNRSIDITFWDFSKAYIL